MRFITERELREQFATGAPSHYEVPADATLTPAARQYLMDLRLFRQGSGQQSRAAVQGSSKPEHMTHLNARELVSKDHPRIVLRGKLDTLEAEILRAMCTYQDPWRDRLRDALNLVREVLAADVKESQLPAWTLDGMGPQEVHECSHHPERYGFAGHILPAPEQGLLAADMNRLRAVTREAELCAVSAYREHDRVRHEDCVLALNRLSSYFYVLQLRAVKEG